MLFNKEKVPSYVFSNMEYLDKMIKDYIDRYGDKNKVLIGYYNRLKEIRDIQNKGNIDPCKKDDIYISLNKHRKRHYCHYSSYGYYTANIHYYLFETGYKNKEELIKYSDTLEKRIVYMIKNSNRDEIIEFWFMYNLSINLINYLEIKYNTSIEKGYKKNPSDNEMIQITLEDLKKIIDKFGNGLEKVLLKELNELYKERMLMFE